jgi:hypothetical protein
MKKFRIFVLCFVVSFPATIPLLHAQDTQSVPSGPKPPLGDITTGWTYLWADQGHGERSNLNGWFLRPSFNVLNGLSIYFDSTNYYGGNTKGSINSHGFTMGVSHTLDKHWLLKPSVSAEVGDVRTSNAGTISNAFVFGAALGLTVPLNKHIALAITPAEYILLNTSTGVRNDFNAKFGFLFPFGHR